MVNSLLNQSKYKDVRLFLWLIPLINCVNYYLTYSNISSLGRFALTFTIDTFTGYISWLFVRAIILWLDKKIPYEANPIKRIAIQVVSTLVAGIMVIILLTELVNWIAKDDPVPESFYKEDIFIISIWFFMVNGIYIGLHYYQKWQLAEVRMKEINAIKAGGFKVTTAKKELLFAFEDIVGFFVEGEYSMMVTTARQKFLLDESLDKVEKKLPSGIFFRLNRQFIVNRQLVNGFEKGVNGKLTVLLKGSDHLPATISVSRTKAPEFKFWFAPE
jgi:DNA-binding LytR/AlgR family response regulator